MKYNFLDFLKESLTDYQKSKVDDWDRSNAVKISAHVIPRGQDRVIIPLESNGDKTVEPHPSVAEHLKNHGYEITDYLNGRAREPKYGREIKIGKALAATGASQDTINKFVNDPNRESARLHNLQIVISRHPHDVAGMSTGRGWTSCLDMDCGINGHYVQGEVESGSHVAYLTKKGDDTIENPVARIALKPWHSSDNIYESILRPEMHSYGTAGGAEHSFHNTVRKWSEEHFPLLTRAIYTKDKDVYDNDYDAHTIKIHRSTLEDADYLGSREFSDKLEQMTNPQLAGLIEKHHKIIGHINVPHLNSNTLGTIIEHIPHFTSDNHINKFHSNVVNRLFNSTKGTDLTILENIASNSNDANTLSKLVHHHNQHVAGSALWNISTPDADVESQLHNPDDGIRGAAVISHLSRVERGSAEPHPHLAHMAIHDNYPPIRRRIAENTNNQDILLSMINDPDEKTRVAALARSNNADHAIQLAHHAINNHIDNEYANRILDKLPRDELIKLTNSKFSIGASAARRLKGGEHYINWLKNADEHVSKHYVDTITSKIEPNHYADFFKHISDAHVGRDAYRSFSYLGGRIKDAKTANDINEAIDNNPKLNHGKITSKVFVFGAMPDSVKKDLTTHPDERLRAAVAYQASDDVARAFKHDKSDHVKKVLIRQLPWEDVKHLDNPNESKSVLDVLHDYHGDHVKTQPKDDD